MAAANGYATSISRATATTLARYYFSQSKIERMFQGTLSGDTAFICANTAISLCQGRVTDGSELLLIIWHVDRAPLKYDLTRAELMS